MVVKLMALRRGSADEGSSADPKIQTLVDEFIVHQEVFLFAAQRGDDLRDAITCAEDFQDAHGLSADDLD